MLELKKVLNLDIKVGDKVIYKKEDENKRENIIYIEKEGYVTDVYDRFVQVKSGKITTSILKVDFFLDLARKG